MTLLFYLYMIPKRTFHQLQVAQVSLLSTFVYCRFVVKESCKYREIMMTEAKETVCEHMQKYSVQLLLHLRE